jgi:hypothetical protein
MAAHQEIGELMHVLHLATRLANRDMALFLRLQLYNALNAMAGAANESMSRGAY